jgi:hypothetical protein
MDFELSDEALAAAAEAWTASQVKYGALKVVAGGRVVLAHLYAGDPDRVPDEEDPRPSLRRLAALVTSSSGRLSIAVRTALLYDKLPEDLRDQLSASHYEVLLGAPEIERERWAREAVGAKLGYRILKQLIADDARKDEVKPGPKPKPEAPPPPKDISSIATARRAIAPLHRQADAVAGHPKAAAAFVAGIDALMEELRTARERALVPNPAVNR